MPPQPHRQLYRPTPYSLGVAALMALHCGCESSDKVNSTTTNNASSSNSSPLYYAHEQDAAKVDAFLQSLLLSSFLPHQQNQQNESNDGAAANADDDDVSNTTTSSSFLFSLHDVPLATLQHQLQVAVSPELAHQWKGWLLTAATTLDAFVDLATSLQIAVRDQGRVDPHSQNGMFLRQVVLGWEELPFEAVVALWKEFQRELFMEEEERQDSSRYDHQQQEWTWTRSSQQMEQSIRTVVMAQQFHHPNPHDPSSLEQTQRMQHQLDTVLQHHPELPAAHFLRFLLCLQAGERVGAMEALHRYMDYALANEQLLHQQQQQQQQYNQGTAAANSTSSSMTSILPLAPILHALLHEELGEPAAVVRAAVAEAVRVAQQQQQQPTTSAQSNHTSSNNDATATTALALGWWAATAQPSSSQSASSSQSTSSLWQRCVERARPHPELRSLQAGASLALAVRTHSWRHVQAATADEDPTAMASRSNHNASSDHHHHYDDRPCSARLASGRAAAAIMARQRLVAAGLWSHLGQHVLSAHTSATALAASTGGIGNDFVLSSSECATAVRNMGMSCLRLLEEEDSTTSSTTEKSSSTPTTTTDDCIYGNALRACVSLREAYQLPVDGVFLFDVALVVHEWAVRRGQLEESEALMAAMESHLHPRMDNYAEIVLDMCSQKALLRSRQGKCAEARQLLSEQIANCRAAGQYDHTARLLLQLSMVQLEETQQQQQQRFTAVLPSLLECLTLSEKHQMTTLHAAALSVLGQVHWRMGEARRAVAVVRAALPVLLRQGHVWMRAQAYLTLARCHLAQTEPVQQQQQPPSRSSSSSSSQRTITHHLRAAAQELERCERLFGICHDADRLQETYYLQARVCNALLLQDGDNSTMVRARDMAAEKFLRLSSRATASSSFVAEGTADRNVLSALSRRDDLLQLAARPGPAAFAVATS